MTIEGGDNTDSKKPSILKRVIKLVVLLLALFCLALVGLNLYISSGNVKHFERLDALNQGSISFEKATFSVFRDFPRATLSLENVNITDSTFFDSNEPELSFKSLDLVASLASWGQDEVHIRKVRLSDGQIRGHQDIDGYSDLKSLFSKKGNGEGKKLLFDYAQLELSNISCSWSNDKKNADLSGHIHLLKTALKEGKGELELDLNIDQLLFNEAKGPYLKNAKLDGVLALDFQKDKIVIAPSELEIEGSEYTLTAAIDLTAKEQTTLTLENKRTEFSTVLPMLTNSLQRSLSPYNVDGEFHSRVNIESRFREGEDPRVEVQIQTDGNDMVVKDYLFMDTKLKGTFINRLYDDERSNNEGTKNMRFVIEELESTHQNFDISSKEGLISSSPEGGDYLSIDALITGTAVSMSEWLDNDQFLFFGGDFRLDGQIEGPLDDLEIMIETSSAELSLQDVKVHYEPADVSFPFRSIKLNKATGKSTFDVVSASSKQAETFIVNGSLTHLSDLLTGQHNQRVRSDMTFTADRLNWAGFLDMFSADDSGQDETEEQKKKSLKSTLEGLYENFQPRVHLDIDEVEYRETIRLNEFKSGLFFAGRDSLVLEKTEFKLGDGKVNLTGYFNINDPYRTRFNLDLQAQRVNLSKVLPELNYFGIPLLSAVEEHAEDLDISIKVQGYFHDVDGLIPNSSTGVIEFQSNTDRAVHGRILFRPDSDEHMNHPEELVKSNRIEIQGNPIAFNEFFDNKEFFFKDGRFNAEFDFGSGITSFEELLNEALVKFDMTEGVVYYQIGDIDLPLSTVHMEIKEDQGEFDLQIRADSINRELNFKGSAVNLSEVIVGGTGKDFSSTINLYSPVFEWKLFQDILGGKNKLADSSSAVTDKYHGMKRSLKGMLNRFDPDLQLTVDSFIYSPKLSFSDFNSGIRMLDENTLLLEKTEVNFQDGRLALEGEFDLEPAQEVPFSFHVKTADLKMGQLLSGLNYIGIDALAQAEKLEGALTMDLDLTGVIAASGTELVTEHTRGILDFKMTDLQI